MHPFRASRPRSAVLWLASTSASSLLWASAFSFGGSVRSASLASTEASSSSSLSLPPFRSSCVSSRDILATSSLSSSPLLLLTGPRNTGHQRLEFAAMKTRSSTESVARKNHGLSDAASRQMSSDSTSRSSADTRPKRKQASSSFPPSKTKKKTRNAKKKAETDGTEEDDGNTDNRSKPWYTMFTKGDKQYDRYMATEWGFEKRGDVAMFEKISLEGAQSGLSWLTILRKREAYRRTFHQFDVDKVAAMTQDDVDSILNQNTADTTQMIVRHRGKIEAVINNARKIQEMRVAHPEDPNPLDSLVWSFVDDKPIVYRWSGELRDANTKTAESIAMSKELKKRGFKFVGPTTCYAMMQSVGMVVDHPVDSPEWKAAVSRLEQRKGGYQEASAADGD
mmetsp:Transcript_20293/g.57620  ORF Transcript_20293/g.57620 Transcript_20293/m.57620 type:complete len:394 (+) Transcript_20293:97-1278(+)